MQIKFIQDFTSPKYGNVWYGRIMALSKEDAQNMINNGYAEELKKEVKNVDSDTDGNKEPLANKPKRGRRSS